MKKIDVSEALSSRRTSVFNRAINREFTVSAAAGVTEMALYDEIGFWGVTASDFRAALDTVKTPNLLLKINSPGGDVFDGIAMYNDLVSHPANVTVEITGVAASAASIVAMGGDTVKMAKNGFLMIHNAWGLAIGNKADMEKFAGVLAQIDGALVNTYADKTGMDAAEIAAMMDAETWLDLTAATEKGFVSGSVDGDAKAAFDLSVYGKAPAALSRAPDGEMPKTKRDAERWLMQDAGLTRSQARSLMAACNDGTTQDAGEQELADLLGRLATTITR